MKTLVTSILPERQINRIRKVQSSGYKLASQAKPLASAYYSLLSRQFLREERAVLLGLAKYHADLQENDANIFLLRRNVHRLEKGMMMRPRRPVFAKEYIVATVNVYRKLVAEPARSQERNAVSLHWAYDVLSKYFEIVAPEPAVNRAREMFEKCPIPAKTDTGRSKTPYHRDLDENPVSYEQLERLAVKRRSVRWYEQKPVPRDLLDKAFTVAGLSPTACNRQPYRFLVFDDPEMVQTGASLPGGTAGFKHNIPVIVAVVGTLDAFYCERDRHVIYIDSSLAAMSFSLALETVGLSSCIFNWPDIEKRERMAEKVLGLEGYERPIMFMGVGYPDPEAMVAYSQKRPLEVIREYNRPINPL